MNFIFRYVAAELATDMVINVGDVKFYLHKVSNLSHSIFVSCFLNENSKYTNRSTFSSVPPSVEELSLAETDCLYKRGK